MSRTTVTSTAVTCDRCGAPYVTGSTMGEYEAPPEWSSIPIRDQRRDLCPSCVVSVRAWFDAPGEPKPAPDWTPDLTRDGTDIERAIGWCVEVEDWLREPRELSGHGRALAAGKLRAAIARLRDMLRGPR